MFARVTRAELTGELTDESVRFVRERAVPALRDKQGFKALFYLLDRNSGSALTIGLWESEADMRANDAEAAAMRAEGVRATGGTMPPDAEVYEVAAEVSGVGAPRPASGRYARVATIRMPADELGRLVDLGAEQMASSFRGVAGFGGGYVLVERATGKMLSVSLWDSETAVEAAPAALAQAVSQELKDLGNPHVLARETYEVAVRA